MVSVSCSAVTLLSSFHNNGSDSLHRRGRTVAIPCHGQMTPMFIPIYTSFLWFVRVFPRNGVSADSRQSDTLPISHCKCMATAENRYFGTLNQVRFLIQATSNCIEAAKQ